MTSYSSWLQIAYAPQVGAVTMKKLLAHFHSPQAICEASILQLRELQLNDTQIHHIKHPNLKAIDAACDWEASCPANHIIPFMSENYPRLLTEIYSPPIILFVTGNRDCLYQPQIAMVGSRHPSYTGIELATYFARELSRAGLCVTSGLALGIDGACHRGALQVGGSTIAVLGSGLNHIYPKQHRELAEKITAHGCLVSEFPLHMAPKAANFPRRNRIISGLSVGTLVVEAALRSGSLITARTAMEQNREVFAIPGTIRNPTSKGCLALIQQGAKLVTEVEDILQEINQLQSVCSTERSPFLAQKKPQIDQNVSNEQECGILAFVDKEMTTIDQICERSKLSAQQVTTSLLQLTLEGRVEAYMGGYIKIR